MFKKKHPIGRGRTFPARTRARTPLTSIRPILLGLATSGMLLTAVQATYAQNAFGNIRVATPLSSKFTWTDWADAPRSLKEATKLIQTNDKTYPTLYDFIQAVLEGDNSRGKIELALIDLNGDGLAGIAVNAASRDWCGSDGCFYDVYDNGGRYCYAITDYNIKPFRNGIKSSAARVFPLEKNPRSKYKTDADVPAIFKL